MAASVRWPMVLLAYGVRPQNLAMWRVEEMPTLSMWSTVAHPCNNLLFDYQLTCRVAPDPTWNTIAHLLFG